MTSHLKQRAALAALDFVEDGTVVGLGTGSTAAYFIEALGARVREGLDIRGVPTSAEAEALARKVGIPLAEIDETTLISLAVDGADEVGPDGSLIKGGGAALLREKIIASTAAKFVVIADGSKDVTHLGAFPLPIEIDRFAYGLTVRAAREVLQGLGFRRRDLSLRASPGGGFVVTDGGNYILDAQLDRIPNAEAVDRELTLIPGVVTTGLFCGIASVALFGREDGVEERIFSR